MAATTDRVRVLWLDDELVFIRAVLDRYRGEFEITAATTLEQAESLLQTGTYDAVITDLVLLGPHGPEGGVDFVKYVREKDPDLPLIVYSAFPSQFSDELRALGVSALISKGDDPVNLPEVVRSSIAEARVRRSDRSEQYVREHEVRSIIEETIRRLVPEKERTLDLAQAGRYELIKPLVGYKKDIEERIHQYPFERNVFLMMKFRSTNADLANFIKETLERHGLNGVRADDPAWNITANVYNPIAVLYCCRFGIALFDEAEEAQAYSPNVAYELGMMHYQGKDCLILRHSSLPAVPFDLIKDLYHVYERDLQVRQRVELWAKQMSTHARKGTA